MYSLSAFSIRLISSLPLTTHPNEGGKSKATWSPVPTAARFLCKPVAILTSPEGPAPAAGLGPAQSKPLRARTDRPRDVPNQPENPAGKHVPRRACHHAARAQPPGNKWEPLQRALLSLVRQGLSPCPTPGCGAGPGSSTGRRARWQDAPKTEKSVALQEPFRIQVTSEGSKERKGGTCVCRR